MARKPDHLADFEADDTGGVLSGLLAEEDELDRRALWRLGSWGVGAVGAVIVAVMANQSSLGLKRDQVAAADLTRQAQQIQSVARESQNEARRLASAIDTLNSDRDRLYSRVTGLEQGLESVTGAIARQSPAAAARPLPMRSRRPPKTRRPGPWRRSRPPRPRRRLRQIRCRHRGSPLRLPVYSGAKDAAKTDAAKADSARLEAAKAAEQLPNGIAKR